MALTQILQSLVKRLDRLQAQNRSPILKLNLEIRRGVVVRDVACKGWERFNPSAPSLCSTADHELRWPAGRIRQETFMRYRSLFGVLFLGCAMVGFTSCTTSPSLTSIVVSPNTMNFGGAGLTGQLIATGYYTHPDHPAITRDITHEVSWQSAATQCVTVTNTGFITSGANICSNILITASSPGFNGLISGTMTVNVTQP